MSFIAFITPKGINQTKKKLDRYARSIKAKKIRMLRDLGQQVVGVSREDYLSGPRPTKLGVVSGDLRRSVQDRVKGDNLVEVGTNLEYGRKWELGEGRPARPFLAPALKDSKGELIEILKEYMKRAKKEAFA